MKTQSIACDSCGAVVTGNPEPTKEEAKRSVIVVASFRGWRLDVHHTCPACLNPGRPTNAVEAEQLTSKILAHGSEQK